MEDLVKNRVMESLGGETTSLYIYGSVSAGWEFCPSHVTFFFSFFVLTNVDLHCDQT